MQHLGWWCGSVVEYLLIKQDKSQGSSPSTNLTRINTLHTNINEKFL